MPKRSIEPSTRGSLRSERAQTETYKLDPSTNGHLRPDRGAARVDTHRFFLFSLVARLRALARGIRSQLGE